ncbi:hypothetical protein AKJ16_DCAP26804, partial [Drosera capensis]
MMWGFMERIVCVSVLQGYTTLTLT